MLQYVQMSVSICVNIISVNLGLRLGAPTHKPIMCDSGYALLFLVLVLLYPRYMTVNPSYDDN